ncbi:MAG: capsule biosynthesis protein, partial [Shimia sp.]
TTKPKAKKYRLRKEAGAAAAAAPAPAAAPERPVEREVVRRPVPLRMAEAPADPKAIQDAAKAGEVASASQARGDGTLDAIRKEGLTGRQLRMARRVAQKHGLAPTSDFEAVKLLRDQGIDPFQRANALELVKPGANVPAKQAQPQLPKTVDKQADPVAQGMTAAEKRAGQIKEIQLDIARRRRKKMSLLFARLAVFVGLPTLAMGYYFSVIASPMYATESSFLIQQNEASAGGAGGGLGGLFGGSQLATVQDSIAVQGYLTSREAMQRLDTDLGFKAHFSDPSLDAITRLPPDATDEAAYDIFKKNVKIGYDPTEGIIKMEVIAAAPEAARDFNLALIGYAEEQISSISQRLRDDQMAGARAAYAEAEDKRLEAAERLVALQTELKTVDPVGRIASIQGRIAQFETLLEERKLELQAQLQNRRPNQARVDGLQREIDNLTASVATQQRALTEANAGGGSLAQTQAQLRIAEVDFQTRDAMLQQALQGLEAARVSAERQVRYIAMSVPPTTPDTAAYPKAFEGTVLSFLIFAGIYLMISLTASILREQVSS